MDAQNKQLVSNIKIRPLKDPPKKVVPRGKIWKLYAGSIRSPWSLHNKEFKENGEDDRAVEGY